MKYQNNFYSKRICEYTKKYVHKILDKDKIMNQHLK